MNSKNSARGIDTSTISRIIILNLIPNTVGDTLSLCALIKTVRYNLPKAHIAITTTAKLKFLFEGIDGFDELIVIPELHKIGETNRSKVSKIWIYLRVIFWIVRNLRKKNFDCAIVSLLEFSPNHLIPWLAGIPIRIGHKYLSSKFAWTLTDSVPFPETMRYFSQHITKTILSVIQPLNFKIPPDLRIEKKVSPVAVRSILAKLKNNGLPTGTQFVVFQCGAKWISKTWPAEKFVKLGKLITQQYPLFKIVIVGSAGEKESCDQIAESIGKEYCLIACNFGLDEVCALVSKARLAIVNDSGIAHISSFVGTQTIVLYGGTHPAHSLPIGIGKTIPIFNGDMNSFFKIDDVETEEKKRLMTKISVEEVFSNLHKLLGASS
ncbi:MAG: glycosyltransferase family 9 protein [Candidatus Woesearchaeota archaeon]|nr:glycosyltransferase family 9 protein [Candidatus Woesearchaeota archaeon]